MGAGKKNQQPQIKNILQTGHTMRQNLIIMLKTLNVFTCTAFSMFTDQEMIIREEWLKGNNEHE